jgi:AcrR family transcriptional regulator
LSLNKIAFKQDLYISMHNTTRERIVHAADQLFYEQGFEHTSFAQIAAVVGISRGNFYYHFKTKDDLLNAVIQHRLTATNTMLDHWEMTGHTAADRIRSFIHILLKNRVSIKHYGCPVGTLCTELAKLNHPAQNEANELFTLFRIWLRRQFEQLGHPDDADALAMHLLALSQGVATLASAFQDEAFIIAEVDRLNDWLASYISQSEP